MAAEANRSAEKMTVGEEMACGCLIQEELHNQEDPEQLGSHMFTRITQAAGSVAVLVFG